VTTRNQLPRLALVVVGAAVLVAHGIVRLPKRASLLELSNTPIDNSGNNDSAPRFRLLTEAARVVPRGASVFVGCTAPDSNRESYFYRFAVALLPERRVLPASLEGVAVTPSLEPQADFVVLLGARPAAPPGTLVRETPDGTVWRREKL
jgi:hypothetical protein